MLLLYEFILVFLELLLGFLLLLSELFHDLSLSFEIFVVGDDTRVLMLGLLDAVLDVIDLLVVAV